MTIDSSVLAPDPDRLAAVERAWAHLTSVGPVLSADERHHVINEARRAWAGAESPGADSGVAGEATFWLAVDAEGLTAEVVAEFEAQGLDRLTYLEIVGVVGLLANVDFYLLGLGAALLPLPAPGSDAPSGEIDPEAEDGYLWVPSVGTPYAPTVLDALPSEGRALRDLHESMYVDMTQIGNGHYADALSKAQIEWLAARTSYLNECFY